MDSRRRIASVLVTRQLGCRHRICWSFHCLVGWMSLLQTSFSTSKALGVYFWLQTILFCGIVSKHVPQRPISPFIVVAFISDVSPTYDSPFATFAGNLVNEIFYFLGGLWFCICQKTLQCLSCFYAAFLTFSKIL